MSVAVHKDTQGSTVQEILMNVLLSLVRMEAHVQMEYSAISVTVHKDTQGMTAHKILMTACQSLAKIMARA
jgi:N-acetylglutamate synthase-like GNAT family acetyltransferase